MANLDWKRHAPNRTPLAPKTTAEHLLEIAHQAESVADELASKITHPRLWEIYRIAAQRGLLRHATNQPAQTDEARHAR